MTRELVGRVVSAGNQVINQIGHDVNSAGVRPKETGRVTGELPPLARLGRKGEMRPGRPLQRGGAGRTRSVAQHPRCIAGTPVGHGCRGRCAGDQRAAGSRKADILHLVTVCVENHNDISVSACQPRVAGDVDIRNHVHDDAGA